MHTKELVVSHFEKNLDWLQDITPECKVIVYDKNEKDSDFIKLPNIGREPHTYLYHIVEHYNSLCDWTIFSQDNNQDHVKDWPFIINQSQDFWKVKAAICVEGAYYFCDYGIYEERGDTGGGYPMGDIWRAIFNTPFPGAVTFAPACNFIVSKDIILTRPLSFYSKLKLILEQVPLAPWVFERYFGYIFDPNIN